MNETKVQAEINKIIEAQTYRVIKQYPAAKHQINTLTELGIIDLVPKRLAGKLGYQDALVIIEAAQNAGKTVGGFNTYGEGDVTEIAASTLYRLIHETASANNPTYDDPEIIVLSGAGGQQTALTNSRSMAFSSGSRLLIWKDGDEWFAMIDGISDDGNFYETDDYGPFCSRDEAAQFMEQFETI